MNTASPAIEWLRVTFDDRRRKAVDRDFRIGPIFTLKSVHDSGEPMKVRLSDYQDPLRWWL
jgi:hypothetical protein